MLNHLLQRYSDNGNDTLGLFFLDGAFFSYALEDEARAAKLAGETRIPAGGYELALRKALSPLTDAYRRRFPDWFTWHVQVLDVPGFENVYIHVGNTEKDTDACILLGDTANNNRIGSGFIGASVGAYERWYKRLVPHLQGGDQARIEIRDESNLFGG